MQQLKLNRLHSLLVQNAFPGSLLHPCLSSDVVKLLLAELSWELRLAKQSVNVKTCRLCGVQKSVEGAKRTLMEVQSELARKVERTLICTRTETQLSTSSDTFLETVLCVSPPLSNPAVSQEDPGLGHSGANLGLSQCPRKFIFEGHRGLSLHQKKSRTIERTRNARGSWVGLDAPGSAWAFVHAFVQETNQKHHNGPQVMLTRLTWRWWLLLT